MYIDSLKRKIDTTIRKNKGDILALINGSYPAFVYRNQDAIDKGVIPVFAFHSLEPIFFESQMRYLSDNGYRSLTACELTACLDGSTDLPEKSVVLTFDDGWGSLWATAYPLMEKYGQHGIAFITPGLIEHNLTLGSCLYDMWNGESHLGEEIAQRDLKSPLCTWEEISEMHKSGVIEFHSHSMLHNSVYTKSNIIDFINPAHYPSYMHSDFNPSYKMDSGEGELTEYHLEDDCLGLPIYSYEASLSTEQRYVPSAALLTKCRDYVKDNGGKDFFGKGDWQKRMFSCADDFEKEFGCSGEFMSKEDRYLEMLEDMTTSKEIIEKKLKTAVSHFCFPWYLGSDLAVKAAKEAGYSCCHWGSVNGRTYNTVGDCGYYINRLNDEYLFSLPGATRLSLCTLLYKKIIRIVKK